MRTGKTPRFSNWRYWTIPVNDSAEFASLFHAFLLMINQILKPSLDSVIRANLDVESEIRKSHEVQFDLQKMNYHWIS